MDERAILSSANVFPVFQRIEMAGSKSEYIFSMRDSMPLNADKRITNAAVMVAIPTTETRVINGMIDFLRLADKYLLAI